MNSGFSKIAETKGKDLTPPYVRGRLDIYWSPLIDRQGNILISEVRGGWTGINYGVAWEHRRWPALNYF